MKILLLGKNGQVGWELQRALAPLGELVAQLPGVHQFTLGAALTLHLNPAQVHVFDARGDLLVAPAPTHPSTH